MDSIVNLWSWVRLSDPIILGWAESENASFMGVCLFVQHCFLCSNDMCRYGTNKDKLRIRIRNNLEPRLAGIRPCSLLPVVTRKLSIIVNSWAMKAGSVSRDAAELTDAAGSALFSHRSWEVALLSLLVKKKCHWSLWFSCVSKISLQIAAVDRANVAEIVKMSSPW